MTFLYSDSRSPYYASSPVLLLLLPFLLLPARLSSTRPLHDDVDEATQFPPLSDLKRYLNRFGYLPAGNFTDVFDDGLQSAISQYQSNLGLAVTGKLDDATVSELSLPRCGVTDSTAVRTTSKFAFFSGKPSWDRPPPFTLTYAFARGGKAKRKLEDEEVRRAFARAFRRWARVIPVTFKETRHYWKADIRIGFYEGDHGDGEPFDGLLGILAHAFSPENGSLHLDASETWAVDFDRQTSSVAIDLESVATHEIGHVLGLGHSSVKKAVMYPSLKPRSKKRDLSIDDVEGVQELYGSNPNFSLTSLAQLDTSMANPRFSDAWRWSKITMVVVVASALVVSAM